MVEFTVKFNDFDKTRAQRDPLVLAPLLTLGKSPEPRAGSL